MRLKYQIRTALIGLQTNKTRSALTILGIVIGITAIMLIMSIGKGAEKLILDEISGLGAETIVVRPGKEPTGPTDFADTLFADSLKSRDLELLTRSANVPDLVDAMPIIVVPANVSYEGETYRPDIFGGSAEFFAPPFNLFHPPGTAFGENEIRAQARIAVIGSKVKEELFGTQDALGEQIRIKDQKFRVTGVLPEKGQVAFLNFDKTIIIPYTAAQQYLLGIDHFHEIIIKTTGPDVVDRAVHDVEATLRESHNITDPSKDDFFVVTQEGVVRQIQTIISTLTVFLTSVVAISLVVGGIGIMNIMLVSVTERTREIGLRKALGATEQNIKNQFLIEAILLTSVGGVIGIMLGIALSLGVSILLRTATSISWSFMFPISAVLLGVAVSGGIGLIFGYYPAKRAAAKSPIEALRYE